MLWGQKLSSLHYKIHTVLGLWKECSRFRLGVNPVESTIFGALDMGIQD